MCRWLRNRWTTGGGSFAFARPHARIPVPASTTKNGIATFEARSRMRIRTRLLCAVAMVSPPYRPAGAGLKSLRPDGRDLDAGVGQRGADRARHLGRTRRVAVDADRVGAHDDLAAVDRPDGLAARERN